MAKEILALLEYAETIHSPFLKTIFVVIIVLLLLVALRKFGNNEFVTVGKEAFDELRKNHQSLKEDHAKLEDKYEKIKLKLDDLECELEGCRELLKKGS